MKRLAGLILILVVVFSLAIAGADSLQTEEYIGEYTFPVTIETGPGISSEQAAENYIMQAFGFLDRPSGGTLLEGTVELSGANKILYEKLVTLVREIAEGRETTAVCEIPMTDFGIQLSYTAQELGVDNVFVNGALSAAAKTSFNKKIDDAMNLDLNLVWNKLRSDYPYEMFWASNLHITSGGYPSLWASGGTEGGRIYFEDDSVFSYPLYVIADYSASQTEGTNQLNGNVMTAVASAVANANDIVNNNAGKTDYDKLKAYKDAICELTSYNNDAAGNSNFNKNAWQLVWALDDDPETKVVCEGYSKAFKALCDLSSFMDASVSIVTGTMAGGTGAGGHMWNLVQIQGKQYLVDVTNCDTGTVGYPDKLFLVGYSDLYNDGEGYIYQADENNIIYVYDNDMYNLYAAEDLEVSHDPFAEQPMIMASATEIALGESVTLTVRVPGQDEFHIYQEKGGSGSWIEESGSTANGQDFLIYTYTPEEEGLYSFYAGYKNATTGTLERTAASVQVNVVYTPPEPITVTGAMKVGTDVTITISKEEEWENLVLEIDYVPNEADRENILRELYVPDTLSIIGTYFQNAGTYQVKLSQINEMEGGGLDYNNPVQLATVNFDMEAQNANPLPGKYLCDGNYHRR